MTCGNIEKLILSTSNLHVGTITFFIPGVGLGMDYVTRRNIHTWIPPTSNLHVGHTIKFPILYG